MKVATYSPWTFSDSGGRYSLFSVENNFWTIFIYFYAVRIHIFLHNFYPCHINWKVPFSLRKFKNIVLIFFSRSILYIKLFHLSRKALICSTCMTLYRFIPFVRSEMSLCYFSDWVAEIAFKIFSFCLWIYLHLFILLKFLYLLCTVI